MYDEKQDFLGMATKYMIQYRRGYLIYGDIDFGVILGSCLVMLEWKEEGEKSESEYVDYIRTVLDFCLEVDREEAVARSVWYVLGHLLYENAFFIFDEYNVQVLDGNIGGYEFYVRYEKEFLALLHGRGIGLDLSHPNMARMAIEYIQTRHRAEHIVRQWLVRDISEQFQEWDDSTFPFGEFFDRAYGMIFYGNLQFADEADRVRDAEIEDTLALHLIDISDMKFDPVIHVVRKYEYDDRYEIRGYAVCRRKVWMIRCCYDRNDPKKDMAKAYELPDVVRAWFFAFAVVDGDYEREEASFRKDWIRLKLMDLWGRDVDIMAERGQDTITYDGENLADGMTGRFPWRRRMKAVFADGVERELDLYVGESDGKDDDYVLLLKETMYGTIPYHDADRYGMKIRFQERE